MPRWTEVATIYEIPDGTVHVVDVEDMEVALFRVDGQVYAIEDLCTHHDVALSEGQVEGTTVYCPLHGAQFCLRSGKALTPPAYEPTRAFPVRYIDEKVEIDLDGLPEPA